MKDELMVFTDGGARGNPGPAAVGVLIKNKSGKILAEYGKTIGFSTNNVAEYTAVIEALNFLKNQIAIKGRKTVIRFFLDSLLVVNQLNGAFRVKDRELISLAIKVKNLEKEIGGLISYHLIPREKNQHADYLVNSVLNAAFREDKKNNPA